jgi:hypothetical protein
VTKDGVTVGPSIEFKDKCCRTVLLQLSYRSRRDLRIGMHLLDMFRGILGIS